MNTEHPWAKLLTGVRGANEFVKAIVSGDVSSPELFEAEREVCIDCDMRQVHGGSSWCGTPFVDNSNHPDPLKRTCGCNLAGMLRVASKKCVQGKHDEVRARLTVGQSG